MVRSYEEISLLTRDALKRMYSIETKSGGNGYERRFNYATRGETAYPVGTTNYVDRISYYNVVNNVATFEKAENIEYNADGHIVTYGDNT